MKKVIVLLFIVLLPYSLFAYGESTHQYLTIEAYQLLKRCMGGDIPIMLNHLHTSVPAADGGPWQLPFITRGAWREDTEDPIYNYWNGNPPPLYGSEAGQMQLISTTVAAICEELISNKVEMFSSTTHFWDPDHGDTQLNAIHAQNFSSDFWIRTPNAYQKILSYKNGGWELAANLVVWGLPTNSDGTGSCATQRAIVCLKYNSLVDLYTNKNLNLTKIVWTTGQTVIYNTPIQLKNRWTETMTGMNGFNYEQFCDNITWEVLGRMCHLLQDMSVPAHAKLDEHSIFSNGESYESYMAGNTYWNADLVLKSVGQFIDPYLSSNPFHFLMYTTAQMAQHFGSDGPWKGDGNQDILGDQLPEEINYLNSIGFPNLGGNIYMKHPISDSEICATRDVMVPQAIRATAGLLYWFVKETGLTVPFTVNMRYNYDNLDYESKDTQYGMANYTKSIEVPKQVTRNGKLYDFVKWSDGIASNQHTFTNSANVEVVYKLHHSAHEITSLANNGQKKFIRSNDGRLHLVYESYGKLWYETSTDNGSTWQVANDSLPLNDGKDGKSPSITTYNNNTIITYVDANSKKVYAESHTSPFASKYVSRVLVNPNDYFEASSPVVSINSDRNIIVAWATTTGSIIYGALLLDPYAWTISVVKDQLGNQLFGSVKGSYASSNPSLESNLLDNTKVFHLVWQDGTSDIKYTKLMATCTNGSYSLTNSTIQTPSQNTGIDLNSEPCVTALNNGTARIVWKGNFEDMNYAIFMDPTNPSNSTYWMFGNNISSPVINAGSETYYIGWTENQSGNFLTKVTGSSTLSSIKTLDNLFGENIQMNGNGLRSQMYVTALNTPAGLPYKITQSSAITSILKESKSMTGSGNVAFLTKDSTVTYYCALGDISSDGKQIDFSEKSDTVKLANFNNLNKCLVSEPFILSNTSKINYTITSGIIAHGSNHLSLKNNEHVTFTVELIDETSQEVISSLGKVSFDSINQNISNNALSYEVNTQGLGNVTARLRLNVYDNIKPLYSLAHRFATGTALNKISDNKSIEINLLSNSVISEYKLNQNYPNPFNPSTVINYQIPKSARVSLKVYDLLGKEVASLVNGIKEAGNYNVQFNAGDLPSGLYIYELRADDFVSCKKLLLVK